MGEFISLSEASLIAVVSIVSVFIILIIIAFIISGLKAFSGEKKDKTTEKPVEAIQKTKKTEEIEDPNMITEELVAVITAAIASSLGQKTPDINIKSIRRVPQMTSNWSNTGNINQVIGKL